MSSSQTPQRPIGPRPTGVRWMVLALGCGTSWLLYLHRYSWGVVKPEVIKEFDFTNKQIGLLDSAFSLTYATFQIPAGLAGDLFGPALVLPLILLAWSLLVGATVLGGGYWSFFGLRMLFGGTQAGAYPNLGKVTGSWFPQSSRTTIQGMIASLAGRAGGGFAPLIISTLLMGYLALTWRQALLSIAVLGILFAVLFRLLFRNSPREHAWVNEEEVRLIEAGEPAVARDAAFVFSRQGVVLMSFGFLLFHIFTSAFADQLFVYWIPQFLRDEKGLSKEAMGIFASLPLFGGAIGGMFGGALNDWLARVTSKTNWARSFVGCTGKLIAAGVVAISLTVEDGRWMMVVVAVGKFFTDWSQPTVWGAITDISGPASGRVFGAVNMAGSAGGIIAGPILGSIIDDYGWNTLFWTIVVVYVLSGLCWLAINTAKPLVIAQQGIASDESA